MKVINDAVLEPVPQPWLVAADGRVRQNVAGPHGWVPSPHHDGRHLDQVKLLVSLAFHEMNNAAVTQVPDSCCRAANYELARDRDASQCELHNQGPTLRFVAIRNVTANAFFQDLDIISIAISCVHPQVFEKAREATGVAQCNIETTIIHDRIHVGVRKCVGEFALYYNLGILSAENGQGCRQLTEPGHARGYVDKGRTSADWKDKIALFER